jgi:hypothetical protein
VLQQQRSEHSISDSILISPGDVFHHLYHMQTSERNRQALVQFHLNQTKNSVLLLLLLLFAVAI